MAITAIQGPIATTPRHGSDATAPTQEIAGSSNRVEAALPRRRACDTGPDTVRQAVLNRLSDTDTDADAESESGELTRASRARRVDIDMLRHAAPKDPRRRAVQMDDSQIHWLSNRIDRAERIQAHRQKALEDLTHDFTSDDPRTASLAKLEQNAPAPARRPSASLSPSTLRDAQFLALPTPRDAGASTPNSGSSRSRFSDWSDAGTPGSLARTTPESTDGDDSRPVSSRGSTSNDPLDSDAPTPRDERAQDSLFPAGMAP